MENKNFEDLPCRENHSEFYDVVDIQSQDDVVLMQCGVCGKLYIYGMKGAYKGELVDKEGDS